MTCEECKSRPATVHLTRIVNGSKVERKLCERCAQAVAEWSPLFGAAMPFHALLSGLVQPGPAGGPRCQCGMTYEDFAKGGRLGCDQCYDTFSEQLGPLLRRIHGSMVHLGKVPVRAGARARTLRELSELRDQLKALVTQERYEEAVGLRDRIRSLEGGTGCSEGGSISGPR